MWSEGERLRDLLLYPAGLGNLGSFQSSVPGYVSVVSVADLPHKTGRGV